MKAVIEWALRMLEGRSADAIALRCDMRLGWGQGREAWANGRQAHKEQEQHTHPLTLTAAGGQVE